LGLSRVCDAKVEDGVEFCKELRGRESEVREERRVVFEEELLGPVKLLSVDCAKVKPRG
jgi:hypothetical protein